MREKIIANNKKHLKSLISEQIKLYGTECDLNHIDISKLIDLSFLFNNSNCEFNGDISKWDMSNATNVNYLFYNSKFNGNISAWDTSKVMNMSYLFENSKFDGDISKWNVFNVIDMKGLFYNSKFNGDVSNWRPLKLNYTFNMFTNCSASTPYWFGNNNKEIVRNINSYDLFNKINDKLVGKEPIVKKMKI